MKKRRIVYTAVVVAVVGLSAGLYLYLKSDPEGIARRNPTSMHAHQKDWPEACHHTVAKRQSPILITTAHFADQKMLPIKTNFGTIKADLVDVGHTFQVRTSGDGGALSFDGHDYQLKQFHFHKPSEHIVDGKQHEMEAHFVFKGTSQGQASAKVLVLGYLIASGTDSDEIARIWQHLPPYRDGYGEGEVEDLDWKNAVGTYELDTTTLSHHEKILATGLEVDLKKLIPERSSFYVYNGSLTTPPCDEGITHAVALAPIEYGHEQIEHFEGYYEGTNRDIQPIGSLSDRDYRRGVFD